MAARIPCTPFGKRVKIVMVEQDTPRYGLARRLGLVSSTVSDMVYSRNCYEKTKEWIAGTLDIRVN